MQIHGPAAQEPIRQMLLTLSAPPAQQQQQQQPNELLSSPQSQLATVQRLATELVFCLQVVCSMIRNCNGVWAGEYSKWLHEHATALVHTLSPWYRRTVDQRDVAVIMSAITEALESFVTVLEWATRAGHACMLEKDTEAETRYASTLQKQCHVSYHNNIYLQSSRASAALAPGPCVTCVGCQGT